MLIGQYPGRNCRRSDKADSRAGVMRTKEFWKEEEKICSHHPDAEEAK